MKSSKGYQYQMPPAPFPLQGILLVLFARLAIGMRIERKLAAFFVVALLGVTSGCKQQQNQFAQDPLRIGMDFTNPPFQMLTRLDTTCPEDELHPNIDGVSYLKDGVSVQMAVELGKYLNRPVRIVPVQFRDLIDALQKNRIDVIIDCLSVTEDRLKQIDFSDPYAHTGLGLLVAHDSTIASGGVDLHLTAADLIKDLKAPGHSAIARLGTAANEFLTRQGLPKSNISTILEAGVAQGMVMDNPNAAYLNDHIIVWRLSTLLPNRTRVVPVLLDSESWGIGVRKGDDALRTGINAFLSKFSATGGFKKLSDEYIPEYEKFLEDNQMPSLFIGSDSGH